MTSRIQGVTVCACHLCDDVLLEAWERMTYGGIQAGYHQNGFPFTLIAYNNNQPNPRNWGTFVTIFGKAAL